MNVPTDITCQGIGPSDSAEARLRDRGARLEVMAPDLYRCQIRVRAPHKQHEATRYVIDIYVAIRDAFNAPDPVGLSRRTDRFPPEMSGGEPQRVAITRALGSKTGVQVPEALRHINEMFGTTTAVITRKSARHCGRFGGRNRKALQ